MTKSQELLLRAAELTCRSRVNPSCAGDPMQRASDLYPWLGVFLRERSVEEVSELRQALDAMIDLLKRVGTSDATRECKDCERRRAKA